MEGGYCYLRLRECRADHLCLGHGTGYADRNMLPDDFRHIINIGTHNRDANFIPIMVRPAFLALTLLTKRIKNFIYTLSKKVELDRTLPVDDPSQQWKFGKPIVALVSREPTFAPQHY